MPELLSLGEEETYYQSTGCKKTLLRRYECPCSTTKIFSFQPLFLSSRRGDTPCRRSSVTSILYKGGIGGLRFRYLDFLPQSVVLALGTGPERNRSRHHIVYEGVSVLSFRRSPTRQVSLCTTYLSNSVFSFF